MTERNHCVLSRPFVLILTLALTNITVSQLIAADCLQYEDFKDSVVGMFPKAWSPRKSSGATAYRVFEEDGFQFVRASAPKLGVEADKIKPWDVERHPVLTWKWRPRQFPTGANERDGKNDSVLGVYVGFSWLSGSLKYIWSETLPVGTQFSTGFLAKTKMHVINTGRPSLPTWVEVRVNVASDYKRRFSGNKIEKPAGIALLTDSDDTGTFAEGDYADFRICRE